MWVEDTWLHRSQHHDEDQDINNEENEEVSIEPDQTEDLNENAVSNSK